MIDSNKIVLQDAIPKQIAQEVRQSFINADYDRITQERKTFYQREKFDADDSFPDSDEIYTAEFYRSNFLEKSDLIKSSFEKYIKPLVEQHSSITVTQADLRVYKMIEGGHFRLHKDDWTASVGFIWYLSKQWKWDWGGLLIDLNKGDGHRASVTIPKFNQLVIMNHQNELPHLVTPVTSFAKEPRFMLVGFLN